MRKTPSDLPGITLKRKVLDHARFGLCVLVPKGAWNRLRPDGRKMAVLINGRKRCSAVRTETCRCRGKGRHEHRFLTVSRAVGAQPGETVTVDLF